jgi:hypothetical protein
MQLNDARSCGGCTKCCEGWLAGEVRGYNFNPGKPCHFKAAHGCSIYEDRPEKPCRAYNCEWLVNEDIPLWLKPSEVNALITKMTKNDQTWLEVIEAGEPLRADVLSFMIMYCLNKQINLKYFLKGGANKIGDVSFLALDQGEVLYRSSGIGMEEYSNAMGLRAPQ